MSYRIWSTQEEDRLKELVATGKYSYRQIGHLMGRSVNSVTSHARQYLDIHNDIYETRKYHHDTGFFAKPNLVNCYVAGFLAADGCVWQSSRGYWTLHLALSTSDIHHLNVIKGLLRHDGPNSYRDKGGGSSTTGFSISISEDYVKDLAVFGIVPHKAYRLTPPQLSDFSLRFAYLLGLLDGDGCVHLSKINNLSVSLTSASRMAIEWYETLVKNMDLPFVRNKSPKIKELSHADAHQLTYVGARAVCLVQLAQVFATKYSLPILARKWRDMDIDLYIKDFYVRYPSFRFDPENKLAELEQSFVAP